MTDAQIALAQAAAARAELYGPPPPIDASIVSWWIFAALCAIALVLTWPA